MNISLPMNLRGKIEFMLLAYKEALIYSIEAGKGEKRPKKRILGLYKFKAAFC
jgi:hypothetical protein